jgi:hypothetical protein
LGAGLNKIQKAVAEFVKENAAITKAVSDDLIAKIGTKTDSVSVGRIVDTVFARHGVKAELRDLLLDKIVTSVNINLSSKVAGKDKVLSFKRWYLENAYSPSGEKLKTVIGGLADTKQVTESIRTSMRLGEDWKTAARRLTKKTPIKADVAGDVQEVLARARRAYKTTGDVEAYRKYKSAVKRVQRRVDGLVDPSTSQLKRAYQDVLDLTATASAEQVESAVEYASYYKQRYNAERIARTEMTKAYGDASFSDALYDEDIIGVQFLLSSAHGAEDYDICDVHCGADLYGMGAGCYPKTSAPKYPFHPHCMCGLTTIMRGETDADGDVIPEASAKDYDPKQVKKYLSSLGETERRELLGVAGADDLNAWQDNLKNWNGQERKKPTIPKKQLYGKK